MKRTSSKLLVVYLFQFVGVECVATAVMDQFTVLRSHKSLVTLAISVVLCLLGLPLCTQVMLGQFLHSINIV